MRHPKGLLNVALGRNVLGRIAIEWQRLRNLDLCLDFKFTFGKHASIEQHEKTHTQNHHELVLLFI